MNFTFQTRLFQNSEICNEILSSIKTYVLGILITLNRKNVASMSRATNIPESRLYNFMKYDTQEKIEAIKKILLDYF